MTSAAILDLLDRVGSSKRLKETAETFGRNCCYRMMETEEGRTIP